MPKPPKSPNEPKPWDPMPRLPTGDSEPFPIFTSVGWALSTWEFMEGSLAAIFKRLCRAEYAGAERAYGAVADCSTRLQMLKEAYKVFHHGQLPGIDGIPDLIKRVGLFAARRNEIAHGHVVSWSHNSERLGCFLCPAPYSSKKNVAWYVQVQKWASDPSTPINEPMGGYTYAYTAAQIDHYRTQFARLHSEAADIDRALWQLAKEQGVSNP